MVVTLGVITTPMAQIETRTPSSPTARATCAPLEMTHRQTGKLVYQPSACQVEPTPTAAYYHELRTTWDFSLHRTSATPVPTLTPASTAMHRVPPQSSVHVHGHPVQRPLYAKSAVKAGAQFHADPSRAMVPESLLVSYFSHAFFARSVIPTKGGSPWCMHLSCQGASLRYH